MKILTLQEVDPLGMGLGGRTTARRWEIELDLKISDSLERSKELYDFEREPHELEFFDNLAKSAPLEKVVVRSILRWSVGIELPGSRKYEVGDRVSIKSKGGSMGGTLGTVAEVDEAKKWLWLALDDGSSRGTRPGLWSIFASDCENLTTLR